MKKLVKIERKESENTQKDKDYIMNLSDNDKVFFKFINDLFLHKEMAKHLYLLNSLTGLEIDNSLDYFKYLQKTLSDEQKLNFCFVCTKVD